MEKPQAKAIIRLFDVTIPSPPLSLSLLLWSPSSASAFAVYRVRHKCGNCDFVRIDVDVKMAAECQVHVALKTPAPRRATAPTHYSIYITLSNKSELAEHERLGATHIIYMDVREVVRSKHKK